MQAIRVHKGGALGWKSILGATMDSGRDFAALLAMVESGSWLRPLVQAEAAHERMVRGEHFGKLVLSIA